MSTARARYVLGEPHRFQTADEAFPLTVSAVLENDSVLKFGFGTPSRQPAVAVAAAAKLCPAVVLRCFS